MLWILLSRVTLLSLLTLTFAVKKNEVTYPPGYNKRLDDGLRKGKANQPITTHDDFMALKSIFKLHEPSRDCSQAMLASWFYLIKDSKSLSEMEASLENFPYTDLRLEMEEMFEEFLNNLRQHEVATTKETQELPVASTPDRFLKRDGWEDRQLSQKIDETIYIYKNLVAIRNLVSVISPWSE